MSDMVDLYVSHSPRLTQCLDVVVVDVVVVDVVVVGRERHQSFMYVYRCDTRMLVCVP